MPSVDDEAVGDEAGHDRRRERFDRCSAVGEGMQDATAGLASAALVRRLRRTDAGGAESGVRNRMIAPAPGARAGERALGATRRGAAHGGAEVHHHLIPRPAATDRHHLVGHRLDSLSRQPLTGEAGEQAGDVRFDNRLVSLEGEHADGPGGIGTDAGQGEQIGEWSGTSPPCRSTIAAAAS